MCERERFIKYIYIDGIHSYDMRCKRDGPLIRGRLLHGLEYSETFFFFFFLSLSLKNSSINASLETYLEIDISPYRYVHISLVKDTSAHDDQHTAIGNGGAMCGTQDSDALPSPTLRTANYIHRILVWRTHAT